MWYGIRQSRSRADGLSYARQQYPSLPPPRRRHLDMAETPVQRAIIPLEHDPTGLGPVRGHRVIPAPHDAEPRATANGPRPPAIPRSRSADGFELTHQR